MIETRESAAGSAWFRLLLDTSLAVRYQPRIASEATRLTADEWRMQGIDLVNSADEEASLPQLTKARECFARCQDAQLLTRVDALIAQRKAVSGRQLALAARLCIEAGMLEEAAAQQGRVPLPPQDPEAAEEERKQEEPALGAGVAAALGLHGKLLARWLPFLRERCALPPTRRCHARHHSHAASDGTSQCLAHAGSRRRLVLGAREPSKCRMERCFGCGRVCSVRGAFARMVRALPTASGAAARTT